MSCPPTCRSNHPLVRSAHLSTAFSNTTHARPWGACHGHFSVFLYISLLRRLFLCFGNRVQSPRSPKREETTSVLRAPSGSLSFCTYTYKSTLILFLHVSRKRRTGTRRRDLCVHEREKHNFIHGAAAAAGVPQLVIGARAAVTAQKRALLSLSWHIDGRLPRPVFQADLKKRLTADRFFGL